MTTSPGLPYSRGLIDIKLALVRYQGNKIDESYETLDTRSTIDALVIDTPGDNPRRFVHKRYTCSELHVNYLKKETLTWVYVVYAHVARLGICLDAWDGKANEEELAGESRDRRHGHRESMLLTRQGNELIHILRRFVQDNNLILSENWLNQLNSTQLYV